METSLTKLPAKVYSNCFSSFIISIASLVHQISGRMRFFSQSICFILQQFNSRKIDNFSLYFSVTRTSQNLPIHPFAAKTIFSETIAFKLAFVIVLAEEETRNETIHTLDLIHITKTLALNMLHDRLFLSTDSGLNLVSHEEQ